MSMQEFRENIDSCVEAVSETFELNQKFEKLKSGNIYVIGSGSSKTAAMYLHDLLLYNTGISSELISPQNMQYIRSKHNDTLITVSCKGNRSDAYGPAENFKGIKIGFTANINSRLAEICDQVYEFRRDKYKHFSETSSILSCMAVMLQFAGSQSLIEYDKDKVLISMQNCKKFNDSPLDHYVFLVSGYNECVAHEGMLKATGAMDIMGEWHNIKQYSHDHNTFSWDKKRAIVLINDNSKVCSSIRPYIINAENHNVIEFNSDEPLHTAPFQHMMSLFELTYAVMAKKNYDRWTDYKKKEAEDPGFKDAIRGAYNLSVFD